MEKEFQRCFSQRDQRSWSMCPLSARAIEAGGVDRSLVHRRQAGRQAGRRARTLKSGDRQEYVVVWYPAEVPLPTKGSFRTAPIVTLHALESRVQPPLR